LFSLGDQLIHLGGEVLNAVELAEVIAGDGLAKVGGHDLDMLVEEGS
jgi:hypothetical protein